MTFDITGLTGKSNRKGTLYYEDKQGDIAAKQCTKCGDIKELDGFNKTKGGLGGKKSECRKCQKDRKRQHYADNPEYHREQSRQHYADNPEYDRQYREDNREYHREKNRQHRADNPEYHREKSRQYYADNPEYYREYSRQRHADNPEQFRLRNQRRRARVTSLPDTLTENQRKLAWERFGDTCALAGDTVDIHMDHVIPISIGHGGTIVENMIPIRGDLNHSKHANHIFEWFDANRERLELSQRRFDELIAYLAGVNDMTTDEYRKYIDWCHDNPRTVDEIKADNEAFEENQRLGQASKIA